MSYFVLEHKIKEVVKNSQRTHVNTWWKLAIFLELDLDRRLL
jgi:hypothetical protein